MSFDIFRDKSGYILFLAPPLVPSERVETGLTRREVVKRLRQVRDSDIRPDIILEVEAFDDADDSYKHGWTAVNLELRYILSRATASRSTPEDVAFVRRTLADTNYPYTAQGHLRHLLRLLAASEKAQGRETAPPPTW